MTNPDQAPPNSARSCSRSMSIIVLNLAIALIVSGIGFGLGFAQGLPAQTVLLYTAVSVAVIFWVTNYTVAIFENRIASRPDAETELADARSSPLAHDRSGRETAFSSLPWRCCCSSTFC